MRLCARAVLPENVKPFPQVSRFEYVMFLIYLRAIDFGGQLFNRGVYTDRIIEFLIKVVRRFSSGFVENVHVFVLLNVHYRARYMDFGEANTPITRESNLSRQMGGEARRCVVGIVLHTAVARQNQVKIVLKFHREP